jgi:hypothetical protein
MPCLTCGCGQHHPRTAGTHFERLKDISHMQKGGLLIHLCLPRLIRTTGWPHEKLVENTASDSPNALTQGSTNLQRHIQAHKTSHLSSNHGLNYTLLNPKHSQHIPQILTLHHPIPPHPIAHALSLGKQLKIRTRLHLQPLEVINMIPVVRDLCHRTRHQRLRHRRKPHLFAVFDDGPTRRMQIDVYFLRGVHAKLATGDD